MKWWEGLLLTLDTETTSADPREARIVTAHLSLTDQYGNARGRTLVMDPEVPIPPEAAAVHGYTTERAQDEGMSRAFGLGALYGALRHLVGVYPLVVFNAAYDLTVLTAEWGRLERAPGPALDFTPVLDPLVMDKAVDKYRRGSRTLTSMAAHYGVELLDAHEASSDALAAATIARQLGAQFPVLDVDPRLLHARQRAWRAEQSASLEEYLRRTDPTATVEGSWPSLPL